MQYSALHNWYTLYLRTSGHYKISTIGHFKAGDSLLIDVQEIPYAIGDCTTAPCLGGEIFNMSQNCSSPSDPCYDELTWSNPAWTPSCCIFARMATIAQHPANVFDDGSVFGPIGWSSAQLASGTPSSDSWVNWTGSGQNWPRDATRIVVGNHTATSEVNAIDLHP